MGYVTQKKMYAERARATGNLDAIAILDGEKKPVTKEELLREDRREYLAGLLEGLTGKYVNLYGKRKATLIKEILTKQEEVLRDARTESKTETTTETTDKSKEATTMKKVTVKELRAQAKAAGLKGYSRMTKAELEAALGKQTLTETVEEETTMKQVEYIRTEQRKLAQEVIERLKAAESSSEKTRILEEANYFTLGGIALEVGMTVPQMPDESGLRERLIAVFVNPESDEARTESTETELLEQADEDDENRPVSMEKYYEEKMRRDFNEFEKRLYGNESEMTETADESDDAKTETRNEARIVLSEIRSESDARKREEKLRSITDSQELEEVARELCGADYVRELLIRELCRNEERAESQADEKPVTRQEFQKAFDELEKGMIYVSIPKLRKKLGWSHEEFDEMIYELRNDETIILHASDRGPYEPEEFFYDEDNERMGMVTWKAA